jgi:cellulose biosynthesis protein BcsQ
MGDIITFYSYKGGVGRSMALANVAHILSRQMGAPNRVLMIDWDLEAPGLHKFFIQQLRDNFYDADKRKYSDLLEEAPGITEFLSNIFSSYERISYT